MVFDSRESTKVFRTISSILRNWKITAHNGFWPLIHPSVKAYDIIDLLITSKQEESGQAVEKAWIDCCHCSFGSTNHIDSDSGFQRMVHGPLRTQRHFQGVCDVRTSSIIISKEYLPFSLCWHCPDGVKAMVDKAPGPSSWIKAEASILY